MGVLKKFPRESDRQIEAIDLPQFSLPLGRKAKPQEVSDSVVAAQPSKLAALMLCCAASGLEDKEIYGPLDIGPAQWSRIRNGDAYFPNNKEHQLMDLCANEIPLRWDALRRNKELKPLRSELEQQLEDERAARLEAERELATIKQFVRDTRAG